MQDASPIPPGPCCWPIFLCRCVIKSTLRCTSAASASSAVAPTLHDWLGLAWCRTLEVLRLPMALDAITLALASQRFTCVAVGMRTRTQLT